MQHFSSYTSMYLFLASFLGIYSATICMISCNTFFSGHHENFRFYRVTSTNNWARPSACLRYHLNFLTFSWSNDKMRFATDHANCQCFISRKWFMAKDYILSKKGLYVSAIYNTYTFANCFFLCLTKNIQYTKHWHVVVNQSEFGPNFILKTR